MARARWFLLASAPRTYMCTGVEGLIGARKGFCNRCQGCGAANVGTALVREHIPVVSLVVRDLCKRVWTGCWRTQGSAELRWVVVMKRACQTNMTSDAVCDSSCPDWPQSYQYG